MICYSSCRKRIRTAQGGGGAGVTFQQLYLIHPHNSAAHLGPRGLPFRGAGPTADGALPANVVYPFGQSVPKGPISSLNVGRGRHSSSRVWRGGRGGRCPHHCSEARATKLAAAQNRGAPACRVQSPPPTCDLDQARHTEAPPSPRALRKTADSVHSDTSQLTSSSQTPRLLTASPARTPQRAGVQIQPSPTSLNPARFCSVSARGPGNTVLGLRFPAPDCWLPGLLRPSGGSPPCRLQPGRVGRTQMCLRTSALCTAPLSSESRAVGSSPTLPEPCGSRGRTPPPGPAPWTLDPSAPQLHGVQGLGPSLDLVTPCLPYVSGASLSCP